MSEQHEGLRPEAAADDAAAAEAAAAPSEERLAEASPDEETDPTHPAGQEEAREPEPEPEPDFKDQYLRAVAELDNVRKRLTKRAAEAEDRGIARAAKELLPAVDDLERALAHAPEDDPLRSGVKSVLDRILASLAKLGVEVDAPQGQPFDPHRHEALSQAPVEGAESGTIVEVYSNGYRLGDTVLRAAKVVVAA